MQSWRKSKVPLLRRSRHPAATDCPASPIVLTRHILLLRPALDGNAANPLKDARLKQLFGKKEAPGPDTRVPALCLQVRKFLPALPNRESARTFPQCPGRSWRVSLSAL